MIRTIVFDLDDTIPIATNLAEIERK